MAGRSASKRRPRHRGVSVEERRYGFVGRYTGPDGRRHSLPTQPSWLEAFDAAREAQQNAKATPFRDPLAGSMTFTELVDMHYLANVAALTAVTRRNIASHLGDGTGEPKRKGAKNERAARFALRYMFGARKIGEIGPDDVARWQAGMVAEGYEHASILAKRSVLSAILELARVNGWVPTNVVDAVPKPAKRQTRDEERVLLPEEWARIRGQLTGPSTLLFADLTLDTGLRYEEISGLRPCDVIDASADEPQHVWIRQVVVWPGRDYTDGARGWVIKEPKGRRWRKVAVSSDVFARLRRHIDTYGLTPDALLFDYARMRGEHAVRRERDPLPERMPHGRFVNPKTGRSGQHGRYHTYSLGCRCPFCRNAYSEYRFWWARARGRQSATPWAEPDFDEGRADAVDPVPYYWFNGRVWSRAVADAGLDWKPTFHDLRHAMVSWSLEGGASARVIQGDAGHASLQTTEVYIHRLDRHVSRERLGAMAKMYERMNGDKPAEADAAGPTPAKQMALAWLNSLSDDEAAKVVSDRLGHTCSPELHLVDEEKPASS